MGLSPSREDASGVVSGIGRSAIFVAPIPRTERERSDPVPRRLGEVVRCGEVVAGAGGYQHGGYNYFTIHEPKERLVAAAPFRDRVLHHAIVRVIEPIFEKRFIEDSFACRRDKGTHAAMRRAGEFNVTTGFVHRTARQLCRIGKRPGRDRPGNRCGDRRSQGLADLAMAGP